MLNVFFFKDDLNINFDFLRIQVLNNEFNKESAIVFLREICNLVMKSTDFFVIERQTDRQNKLFLFSTDEAKMDYMVCLLVLFHKKTHFSILLEKRA